MDQQLVSAAFPAAAASVSAARRFVRRVLTEWGMEIVADDAVLATSELATNAVTYAGTSFEVCCRVDDDKLHVEVRDHHPTRRIAMPGLDASSGRGLPSTARLADSWGVTYDRLAKSVWFRLPASDGSAAGSYTQSLPLADSGAPPVLRPGAGEEWSPAEAVEDPFVRAVETVRDVLGAEGAAVLLTERDGRLKLGASDGLAPEVRTGSLRVADLGPEGQRGIPWVLDDVPAESAAHPIASILAARSLAAAPLRAQGRTAGVLVAVSAEPGRFGPSDAERLGRIADEVALSLERARVGELERSWRGWLSFVAEASDLLAGTLDQERTMALVAQLVVPRLASWCAVYTVDEAGKARPAYTWHLDETRIDALRKLLDHADPVPAVDVPGPWNGFGSAPEPVRDEAGSLVTDLAYNFPLIARGRRIGMIVIGRPKQDRFLRGVIDLAEELSRRAALAIDNARLYSAQMAMSSALQRSLLPPAVPEIPGLEVAVVYEPAGERSEVGGDFYDVFNCVDEEGRPCWRFAIGDVCGTGPEAAAVTGLARHALRILAAEGLSVPDVLTRLNRLILGEGTRARLLTLLHGEISLSKDGDGVRLRLVSAGHPPALVLHPDGLVAEAVTAQPLLGVIDEVEFEIDTVELKRGQVLLCVTDGVTERRADGRLLGDDQGLERLLGSCTGLSAGAVAARVQRAVRDFGPEPSGDDVALIALRVS
ncbi:SpoIIE family protein phosphatase [Actinomadura sp. HBU206391]|uniref:SpoIIE family protein phosphatase n=1 Tax=Actinomadura sp. HBU206391 TaxID=2731692 RepID=UPI00164FF7C9|nr:SpoIIE family protein phosphatase [Actinomadura sp. HBU206391]MBC6463127.1 SpoIIE family protein phosphatase [Actinomadura sp. HBU206391]